MLHRQLMLLGLLRRGPLHGYEIHRIVRAHGEMYADLKKANVYYLLERLAKDGHVEVSIETGTQGRRGERLIYMLTDKGQRHFFDLLRTELRSFTPTHSGVDVAVVYLDKLPRAEALALLSERREAVAEYRERVVKELGAAAGGLTAELAADHLVSLIEAELAWTERTIERLRIAGAEPSGAGHDG